MSDVEREAAGAQPRDVATDATGAGSGAVAPDVSSDTSGANAPDVSGDASVVIAGEKLVMLPERALCWPRLHTLFIADAHFGKAASFRAHGVPLPRGTTLDGVTRADALLTRTRARRVVFLGDFLHARNGRAPRTLAQIQEWRERHPDVDMLLVRGNHDRHAGDPPPELGIECVDEPHLEAAFVLAHHPQDSPYGYVLAGHIHPAVRLTGRARQSASVPCFRFTKGYAVLPAFGSFTGTAAVDVARDDRVFVIADGRVLDVSPGRRPDRPE